jgi:class 3 adenylate cyclase
VLLRDGDVYGPVVNLAARAVKAAAASEVVAPMAVPRAAGLAAESLGLHELKGIGDDVELCRVKRR